MGLGGLLDQVGFATGHSAAVAGFNWSTAHISVNSFWFFQNFLVAVVCLSFGQFVGTRTSCCPSFLFYIVVKRMLCPSSDHVCSFQALLHHCFVWLMKHVAAILQRKKIYSLDLTTTNIRRGRCIRVWEGKELVIMAVAHCGRDVPAVRICVLLCSQLLSVVSLEPTIICCADGSADFTKVLDKALNQKAGIQYLFNFLPLQIEKLMHKPSFSVMGKIDLISIVRTLLVKLSGLLGEKWTQSTQYFRKVR